MKRKLMVLMLVLVMIISSLTACSEPVTAESLIDDTFSDISYMECEMNLDLEMELSVSGMSMDMALDMTADMEITKDVMHMVMSMDMDAMGMSESYKTELYTVTEDDTVTTYTYDETYEQWTYVESEVDEDAVMEISSDMFEDLELEETEDGYVVTGTLSEVEDLLEGVELGDDTFGEVTNLFKDVEILVTMTFDKDKVIEEMEMEFNIDEDDVFEIEGVEITISKIKASAEYKNVNEDEELEVPEEVLDEAVEADGLDNEEFFEDDYEDEIVEDETEDEVEPGSTGLIPMGGITGTNAPTLENIVFVINDTEFSLSTLSLEGIKALGYSVDDYNYTEGSEYIIMANDYEYISLYDENICSLYLYYRNNTENDLDITECALVGIDFTQDYEMRYENEAHCKFSIMGLAAGATAIDAETLLGTPDDYYEGADYCTYFYYLDNNYDAVLELEFVVGIGLTSFDVHSGLYY